MNAASVREMALLRKENERLMKELASSKSELFHLKSSMQDLQKELVELNGLKARLLYLWMACFLIRLE